MKSTCNSFLNSATRAIRLANERLPRAGRNGLRRASTILLLAAISQATVFGGGALPVPQPGGASSSGSANRWQSEQQQQSSAASPVREGGSNNGSAAGDNSGEGAPAVASREDYRLGATDIIDVRVEDAPELSRKATVSADGTIQLSYLNQISVAEKTTQQVEKIITDGLRGRYLIDPHVTVTVLRFNSRSYFIEGAVHSPGLFIVQGNPSLMKLITLAGGLTDNHGSTAFIIRELKPNSPPANVSDAAAHSTPKPDAGAGPVSDAPKTDANPAADKGDKADQAAEPEKAKYELIKANINGLFKGEFQQDRTIEPGDIINIPPTDVFFVAGEVRKPGSFPLKEGTTLRQAVSMAEGTDFKAALGRSVIFRDNPATGKREEIKVDVGAIMRGSKEDVPILANDIIVIPNSRTKTMMSTVLSGMGMSAMMIR
jgi:protein involved in polysaccharide export with SLBB domain